jgi:hypothetical protein
LRGIEHWPGVVGIEATGEQFAHDAMEGVLNVVEGVERRQLPVADFSATSVAGEREALA